MTELPSEPELIAGRMHDGSCPPLRSGELYHHWDKPIPGGRPDLTPLEIDAQRLHYQINQKHLAQLDTVLEFSQLLVNAGISALKTAPAAAINETKARGANPGRVTEDSQTQADPPGAIKKGSDPLLKKRKEGQTPADLPGRPVDECSDVLVPPVPFDDEAREIGKIVDAADKLAMAVQVAGDDDAVGEAPTACAGGAPALHALPLEKLLPLAEKGARLLVTASAKRAELAHKLVEQAFGLDVRKSFLQDRAVAVVYATLLHLDEQFRDVGFGSWMPFRFPDQWLAFCGIMRRVLAANGLIHSRHADVYRKLLDETPAVEIEGEIEDRIKMTRTPINPARCWENRGAENMTELGKRLWHEVDNPPHPPPRKQYAPD